MSLADPIERAAAPLSATPRIGLALGGGGARGIAHIHVLAALDDLGVKPVAIAGSSIGAMMGAAYAGGFDAKAVTDYALDHLGRGRVVLGHLWRTRAGSIAEFLADGGLRFGQLNAERVIGEFMPIGLPPMMEELAIPLTVMASDFYGCCDCALSDGDLMSALAASIALPAVFRPVRRNGRILVDGGICNPLPYDQIAGACDLTVAVDVTGPPETEAQEPPLPSPIDAMMGASQLMMHSAIETRLRFAPPDVLLRPPVSRYRVLDFMRVSTILDETRHVREEAKRRIGEAMERAAARP